MITRHITCVQSRPDLVAKFFHNNMTLPKEAYFEKMYQMLYQVVLLGQDRDCAEFFAEAEHWDAPIPEGAQEGTISLRVDYDANYNYGDDEHPEIGTTEHLVRSLSLALANPHQPVQYPDRGDIDHIRVSIVVAPGKVMTKSYWPQQLGIYLDPNKMYY